jgi:tricorn protease interacting factor F2/3
MKSFNPINYKIFLDIDIDNIRYSGISEIKVIIEHEINELHINCRDIEISNLKINNIDSEYNYDKKNNLLILKGNFIKKQEYLIKIEFKNIISDDLEGIYYIKEDDNIIICTQLEPDFARRVFPCFDDPDYKSTFDISVKINKDLKCLSNMTLDKKTDLLEKKLFTFKRTPLMSTYLVCIIIGDLKPVLEKPLITDSGILVNGYCIKKHLKYMKFAVEHTVKAIEYYEKWFNYKYQLPKLDIVSIPNFRSGAMENWGLITFREDYILLYNDFSDFAKITILEVIYHEIAHQWFGNLVTLDSWSNLWLNESNATYFSWIALNENYPEFSSKSLFNMMEYKKALLIDGLPNTHPIIPKKVSNPSDLFDEISYAKGSCLIAYICGLLGEENFKKSIQKYILNNTYSNTTSEDLYKYFNSDIDISKIISDLINIKGYPLIEIELKNNDIILRKSRFILNNNFKEKFNTEFYVKLQKYNTTNNKNNNNENILINFNSDEIVINMKDNKKFYLNPNNSLLCVVKYINLKPDIKMLKQEELLKYICDEFILMFHNYNNFNDYLEIISNVIKNIDIHDNIIVYINIINELNKLFYTFKAKVDIEKYKKLYDYINVNLKNDLLRNIIKIKNNRILYSEELLNEILLLLTIYLKDEKTIKICKDLFNKNFEIYKKNNKFYLNKSLFKIINYYYPEYFIKIYNLLLNHNTNSDIINHIIESFEFINKKFYEQIIEKELYIHHKFKLQNYTLLFLSISRNLECQVDLIKYIISKNKNLNKNHEIFLHILQKISSNLYNNELINIFIKFLNLIKNKKDKISYNKIFDILEINKNINIK